MPHPSDIEIKLGFDQIKLRLKSHCLSALGTGLVDQLSFYTDPLVVISLLNQNHEFVQIFLRGDSFPVENYFDPSEAFKRAAIEGSYLEEQDFLSIANSVQTILSCKNYLKKNKELCPVLFELTAPVLLTDRIVKLIFSVIDDRGIVKDNASIELAKIRKRLREEQIRLRKSIDQVYKYALEQNWVPEGALPTIRGGRLAIPVMAEYKRKLKGFILDESATGQTVFMEPAEALEANNEIRDLEHAEKREAIKILLALTDELRNEIPQLLPAFNFLAWIDFVRAKSKLAMELNATLPNVVSRPALNWMDARHPLLYFSLKGKRKLIPLTIALNERDRILLVSGPNAGGKSVCLKTVGLLQYMVQCGMLIPASPDSTVGIFDNIFIDIGDQQSIENDLSTYSSHLKNLGHFIKQGTENSMVLLDELGSGTDPNFGGAIAQAVLSSLIKKKVWGVATTHYYNLKLYAEQNSGISNAAMRFDEKNMVPLYQLDIGKPGSSFALEIAFNTGMPHETLQEAKNVAGTDLVGIEKLARSLEREKALLSDKLKSAEEQNNRLKNLLKKYEDLTTELESQKKEILKKAKQEAQELLTKTNREIEKTIRHIRENQAQKNETRRVRKNLEEISNSFMKEKRDEKTNKQPIQKGDRVRIIGQDGSGVVLSISGKAAIVQLGELKSKIELSKLELADSTKEIELKSKLRSVGLSLHEKRTGYTNQLDVRGKRVDEVIPMIDQFLDTSVLLGEGEVKILHGKGEGVLRKVVRDRLSKYKFVASFGDEHVERGGDGITVVVMK